jgi:hypothetical protein
VGDGLFEGRGLLEFVSDVFKFASRFYYIQVLWDYGSFLEWIVGKI